MPPLATSVADVLGIAAAALGFAALGGVIWISMREEPERVEEERAREHFDRHGRWPDEH